MEQDHLKAAHYAYSPPGGCRAGLPKSGIREGRNTCQHAAALLIVFNRFILIPLTSVVTELRL